MAWLKVHLLSDLRASTPLFFSLFLSLSSVDGRVNKTATRMVIGPKYNELRDWHHGVSARTLNVQ